MESRAGLFKRQMAKAAQVIIAAATALTLVACNSGTNESSEDSDATGKAENTDYFGYLVDVDLVSTNAASDVGASLNAEVLSGRLYPAIFLPGPSGQMIPNTDLAQTQVLPGANRQVVYTLTEEARYSDGTPVTCTDFLLHVKAGQHSGLFGSHLPLVDQVLRLDCNPGQKNFTVVFDENNGGRWRHLFGAGTVLPAHAIAQRAGMTLEELHHALESDDLFALQEVAQVWNTGFNLADFDPQLQVTFGPFVIDHVGESGEAVLAPNENFFGDAPNLDKVVVWPRSTDPQQLIDSGNLRIVDARGAKPAWLNRDDPENPFLVEEEVGELTDTLMLGNAGTFAEPWARQAFAACVDQTAVAQASSRVAGIEVPPVTLHTLPHHDPLAGQLADIANPHVEVNLGLAQGLAGATIRVGYAGPDERKAQMVESIAQSCEAAGISVVDASIEGRTLADLTRVTAGQWGEQVLEEGPLDAVLMAVDPMGQVDSVALRTAQVEELRSAETTLWEEVPSIPLSAQPRRFVIDHTVGNVVAYTGLAGIGWNMDRWHVSEDDDGRNDPEPTQ